MCPLRVSFCFLQPSTPRVLRLHGPSEPDVLGTRLLSAGPLGWDADVGLRPLAPQREPLQL